MGVNGPAGNLIEPNHQAADAFPPPGRRRRLLPLRGRDIQLYRSCDLLTEWLIYPMVLFSPWAFGTSGKVPWAVWTMNGAGYVLGALLLVKLAVRGLKGYAPPRWGEERMDGPGGFPGACSRSPRFLARLLAGLTVAILAYCLVSALNAQSTFNRAELRFDDHEHVRWLPHSLDSGRTWLAFWTYLGLACSFWAVRDWLLGKSAGEERAERKKSDDAGSEVAAPFPARLRRLLWLLCVNGALLGIEGIVQRLEGSGKLLFFVQPRVNPDALSQFGPYAYRSNASQYFNLIWPVCLGFWWILHRAAEGLRRGHHLLLLCGAVMAACPIISSSRGGTFVTVAILALASVFLLGTHFFFDAGKQGNSKSRITGSVLVLLFVACTLGLGYGFGWKNLEPRLTDAPAGFAGREQMFDTARPIAADYPIFGTGPGTFEPIFQLYRVSTETYWPAQLHNDWLETRITFGGLGSALILLALLVVLTRCFASGGIVGGWRFTVLIWLALAGCLVHARWDFPFQMHSIVFLFLLLCAILFNLSRRR